MLDKCYLAAFLHDAIGMNVGLGTANRCSWIERECAQELVERILSPFATRLPTPEMYTNCQVEHFSAAEFLVFFSNKFCNSELSRRLGTHQKQLDVYVEFLKPWFDTVRGEMLPKPLFRALCLLCGSEHTRFFIANRLDVWINLQKFHREISELLLVIGANINAGLYELDRDVIDILLKLNTKSMKTRTVIGPFTVALKRICEVPANVEIVLESLFVNETGPPQNRSPTNLQTIYMILNCHPIETTRALARITSKELFKEKENSIKMLRAFLRELIRGFYHSKTGEFPFSVFAETLFKEVKRRDVLFQDEVPALVVDLLSQIPLATLSSLLVTRESAFHSKYNTPNAAGEFPLIPPEARLTRDRFQQEFVAYSENVIEFLATSRKLFFDEQTYIRCFSLLLFLEKQKEVYTGMEMAAVPDAELPALLRIFGECGVSEKMFILLCNEETNDLPQTSLIDLISALTQRAALYHPIFTETPLIQFSEPFKLIDAFLKMSIYPKEEIPRLDPPLSDRTLYWRSWTTIVLWIAAGSDICPFFEEIYSKYPILRYLVHCIMTKKFQFPVDFEGKSAVLMKDEEAATETMEATVMNMYEEKMAQAVPPDSFIFPTSFRAPVFMDDFQVFSENFKLASRFARCTSPPLLSRLISSVGAQNSLAAVREMLGTDSSTATMLTSECVFHALLYYFDSQRMREAEQSSSVVVKALIRQAETNLKSTEPVEHDFLLHAFISSLASPNASIRGAVVNAFSRLFPSSSEDKSFDLVKLAQVPRFNPSKLKYMETMASAVLVESDTLLANSYLQFLTANSMENDGDHTLARAVCQILSTDCLPLHSSLCEYFLQYVDMCTENQKVEDPKSIAESLCCVDFGKFRVALSREVPVAVIKLLSKYDQNIEKGPFESLVQFWLSPGSIPRMVDRSGATRQFLNLPMRKEMLKSGDQRVVDAALEDLSEKDAQEFVLVSQMSTETAEKVIRKAENMSINGIDKQLLANMYLLIRGYRMRGVLSGESLLNRLKEEIDRIDAMAKEEEMEMTEYDSNEKPSEFLYNSDPRESVFSNLKMEKMKGADITNWLKLNCSANTKNKDQATFRLPPEFIQSAMNENDCALACLTHIEINLKYILSHEAAFQTLIVIIDSAANKFNFVRNRLETFGVKILKSVSPPPSVIGILQKHAANSNRALQNPPKDAPIKVSTFAEFASLIKSTENQQKRIVDTFMATFMEDKGEVIESEDVLIFIKSIQIAYNGGDPETTSERCLSNRWSPQLRKVVCTSLLEKFHPEICPVFVFRLMTSYCRMFPIASYAEMFTIRDQEDRFVLNKNSFQTSVIYFCNLAARTDEYDLQIGNLIVSLEQHGSTQFGFYFCRALLQTSCAHPRAIIRNTAKRLLETLEDRLPYISYKPGSATSIRILTNVESRESCIRRCEQIVDRLVEMPIDPSMALAEDLCEEEKQAREALSRESRSREDEAAENQRKRGMDSRRGGPPSKKGRFISAKDLPIPLGATSAGPSTPQNDDDNSSDEPVKLEWIATSHAMTRFVSLIREHPNIVKMKLPVLANYISRVNTMTRRELKDEKRVNKVELIIQSIIQLCRHMKPEEMTSVDTALANCLEFYEKHLEDGGFGVKELTAYAELLIRACAEYLNHSFMEARTFLRDNRRLIDRVCKRCHERYYVDLVLDNSQPIAI